MELAIDKAMKDLPPLPTVVTKVMEVTGDSTSSSTELERYISSDQAISAKVLRVVNSAYFGLSGRVSSVGQAIVILGFNHIRNLVLSIGASSTFSSGGSDVSRVRTGLWEHAFATAACAQAIARKKRLDPKDHELVFIGGLLSNLGGLFLLSEVTTPYLRMVAKYESERIPIHTLETDTFGFNHADIGMELAKRWRLPENLILLIGRHEGPFDGEPIPSVYSVHVADRFASCIAADAEATISMDFLEPLAAEWLGLDDEELLWLQRETALKVESASELLGVFAA